MIELDKYKTITINPDAEITADLVKKLINIHFTQLVPNYRYLEDMYLDNYEILDEPDKDKHKPDNRIVVNMAKYMIDTYEGYRLGIPLTTKHPKKNVDEYINDFERLNSINDVFAETSKITSIYGHGYFYLYQDEKGETRITYQRPTNMFLVYDNSITMEPKVAIRYRKNKAGRVISGEVITDELIYEIRPNKEGNITLFEDGEDSEHIFDGIPVVESMANLERKGIYESVTSMMNALNKALSEKANDVDYFADAYLHIHSKTKLDKDQAKFLRDDRIINTYGDEIGKVRFLDKPDADKTQENLIEHLWDKIFATSSISDLTDKNFGNSSGNALEYKLHSMDNTAKKQNGKFANAIMEVFRLVFSLPNNKVSSVDYQDINITFTENVPHNRKLEAEIFDKYYGKLSLETILGELSFVPDPEDEIELIEGQKEKQISRLQERLNRHLTDGDLDE